ncbi:glycosyltransferase family 2 protein [Gloeocapsa sp. PCC 73106]|uniref:glycosyltransferase n=1 Tax=Gloeocapsa sp. PCC 73106 TaxID=102232 RepID=UPI0002AC65DD|nr:glycosyltransferase family 2 protein [Gloeocapsa sp. PCC 73106]ELR99515.1 glycosyl transferase [Gloeocapsa sp. PCC 73106]
MSDNYWSEKDVNQDIDPVGSLISEWTDPENLEAKLNSVFFDGLGGRRRKAALTVIIVSGVTVAAHLISWGYLLILGLSGLLLIRLGNLILAEPEPQPQPLTSTDLLAVPFVSLLVAAKNEEKVIGKLVEMLLKLDYPRDKYEIWVIDDHSSDRTGTILDQLALEHPQLKVLHRTAGAGGGKSGALNQVLPRCQGDIIGVFDADAQVSPDLLLYVLPLFQTETIGAVQVRKAITNADTNFWTKGQEVEMALDSYLQQQRIAIGGMGELRGNGQFVRRSALEACGGWNEETITDDLDLTIRLHLDQWEIGFLPYPAVGEEGVSSAIALWHQRNRWAEGGYQRYLDYWRFIASKRLSLAKKLDLLLFFGFQYLLPTAAVPDLVMVMIRHRLPVLSPVSTVLVWISCWSMLWGLIRIRRQERSLKLSDLMTINWQILRGMIYMLHWLVVMPSTIVRMSVRQKRLKWVKTTHQGGLA